MMNQLDKHKVHQKIRLKLWVYVVVFLASLMLSIIHFVNGHILFYFPLGGFFAGLIIGFVVSRIHKITWDEDGEVIITKIDSVGLLILLGYYILFFQSSICSGIHFFFRQPSAP